MDRHIFSKISTLLVLIGISQVTWANKLPADDFSFMMQNGFYAGVNVGAADFMNKESHSVSPESHQLGDIGAVGGVFVGYDYGLTNVTRLALEGFIEATNLTTKIKHASSTTYQMDEQYNMGIRILPEYVFTPFTVGHLIIGYVNGRFHIHDNGVYGLVNSTYSQNGVQAGAGLTTVLKKNIFVRLDALYDAYPSKTTQGQGLPTGSQFYTNRFSQLTGELSLIYKIA